MIVRSTGARGGGRRGLKEVAKNEKSDWIREMIRKQNGRDVMTDRHESGCEITAGARISVLGVWRQQHRSLRRHTEPGMR